MAYYFLDRKWKRDTNQRNTKNFKLQTSLVSDIDVEKTCFLM